MPRAASAVEKIDPLAYRLTYRNKSVIFALNDLSQVKPRLRRLRRTTNSSVRCSTNSACRFFLVFNSQLKLFHYILDETITPADVFVPAPVGNGRILIGKRTGFAVYRDQHRDRKILIGAFPRQCGGEQLPGRPVRSDAGQFHQGRYFPKRHSRGRAGFQRPDQSLRQFRRRRALRRSRLTWNTATRRSWRFSTAAPPAGAFRRAVRRLLRPAAGRRPWRKRAAARHAACRCSARPDKSRAITKRAGGFHCRPANPNVGS